MILYRKMVPLSILKIIFLQFFIFAEFPVRLCIVPHVHRSENPQQSNEILLLFLSGYDMILYMIKLCLL